MAIRQALLTAFSGERRKTTVAVLVIVGLLSVVVCLKSFMRSPSKEMAAKDVAEQVAQNDAEEPAKPAETEDTAPAKQDPVPAKPAPNQPDAAAASAAKATDEGEVNADVDSDKIIRRPPIVLYVLVAGLSNFLLGFLTAMQCGYRPRLFRGNASKIRASQAETDPVGPDPPVASEKESKDDAGATNDEEETRSS